ncbi:MAG: hypothetical protein V1644_01850 [Candidatus Micrarchaeota archaeon]
MKYKYLVIAVVLIMAVVLLPNYLPQTASTTPTLSENEVVKIAENYVKTTLENVTITKSTVSNKTNDIWKITIYYEQRLKNEACKVGKCYWEGPASMFCRVESNQTLGLCQG